MKLKYFKNPDNSYSDFKTTKRPHSISPKRKDYLKKALKKDDHHSKCTYIDPNTNKRCKMDLEMYPRFCKLHTILVENLYIGKSNISQAGNGLFVGPYGFKKN